MKISRRCGRLPCEVALAVWGNARGAQDYYRAYTEAVHDTYPVLKQTFAAPDLAAGHHLRTAKYIGGVLQGHPWLQSHAQILAPAQP
ncbi:hypothetical protein ACH4PR_00110 [Streptomyces mirabilis]|uniref:hypothetical protein n=1 Tax=Streptomyces mirabilis TaxID=68239 RepID=UPI0037AA3617